MPKRLNYESRKVAEWHGSVTNMTTGRQKQFLLRLKGLRELLRSLETDVIQLTTRMLNDAIARGTAKQDYYLTNIAVAPLESFIVNISNHIENYYTQIITYHADGPHAPIADENRVEEPVTDDEEAHTYEEIKNDDNEIIYV